MIRSTLLALISTASGQEIIDPSRESELRKMVPPMTGYENNYCAMCIHTLSHTFKETPTEELKTVENVEEILGEVCNEPLKFMFKIAP